MKIVEEDSTNNITKYFDQNTNTTYEFKKQDLSEETDEGSIEFLNDLLTGNEYKLLPDGTLVFIPPRAEPEKPSQKKLSRKKKRGKSRLMSNTNAASDAFSLINQQDQAELKLKEALKQVKNASQKGGTRKKRQK
jgi:hypothetical protein